ncbi:hypothetical protein BDZ94DRAFT_1172409 [Collybia nuda]|uniref:Uncharacterized protein n=1 Tax=Collybia nuda TaxID=64659 RepID=A0A9P5XWV7_9AGAR|nr:hypothetical protein BDZ94DRAFT_1172409 [Collybia nuda]
MRKCTLKVAKTSRVRPVVPKDQKECLVTYVKVNGQDAWTLWDSGSTTTGITPAFHQYLANIPVFALEDPHILQLGTTGSRANVNYGLYTQIETQGTTTREYLDVANFDRYDMIVGTPYMYRNKVKLDFEKKCVVVNGVSVPATPVIMNDTDG